MRLVLPLLRPFDRLYLEHALRGRYLLVDAFEREKSLRAGGAATADGIGRTFAPPATQAPGPGTHMPNV